MSGEQPKDQTKKMDQGVLAMMEQLTRDGAENRKLLEAIKESQKSPAEEAAPEFDPMNPPVMDFATAETRSVFETNLSALTRVQKSFAQQEAKGVALESFQRGLEEVPLDVQNRASRLELAWWQSDQQFGHLMAQKGGSVGMWLSRHFRLLIIGIVAGVLGSILAVRLTDPAVLDSIGTQWGNISPVQQFLFIAMVFSVIAVIIFYLWRRGKAGRPETAGTVS